jgi:hypothetical protein
MINGQLECHGGGAPWEKWMPCLTTLLVFFHSYCSSPQGVVDFRGGLGYRILICHPIQRVAGGIDLQVIACPGQVVVQFPIMECPSMCMVLLVSGQLDAIDAIRQIIHTPSARCVLRLVGCSVRREWCWGNPEVNNE